MGERTANGSPLEAILTVTPPPLPEPFELSPANPEVSFPALVKVDKLGATTLASTIAYSGTGVPAGTRTATRKVIAPPLVVTLRAKPLVGGQPIVNMELTDEGVVTDGAGNPITPKVEVILENQSTVAVSARIQGVDPRARDRSALAQRIRVTGGGIPVDVGTIAAGAKVMREYALEIAEDGRFEFNALVTGTPAGSVTSFNALGKGAPIAVGEPYPVEIEIAFSRTDAITNENKGAFFVQPGSSLGVVASVKNLTSNKTLKFYGIRAEKRLNAFGSTLTSDQGRLVEPFFAHDHEVAAGGAAILSGEIRTEAAGSPNGFVKWQGIERAKLKDDATNVETAVVPDDVLVTNETGGWLGDKLSVRVIQDFSRPPAERPLTGIEGFSVWSYGTMLGMGEWTYDSIDAIGGIGRLAVSVVSDPSLLTAAMGNGSRAVWESGEMLAITWKHMSADEKQAFAQSLVSEVQRRTALLAVTHQPFDPNDGAAALAYTQNATYSLFGGIESAYASNDPFRITQEWGRVSGHVAMEVGTAVVPSPRFTSYTKASELARLADNTALSQSLTIQEDFLRAVKSGPVGEATTIAHWGVGGKNLADIQDLFFRFKVVGYMRERAPEAFKLTTNLARLYGNPRI